MAPPVSSSVKPDPNAIPLPIFSAPVEQVHSHYTGISNKEIEKRLSLGFAIKAVGYWWLPTWQVEGWMWKEWD
jgi:hypothetical protein